MDYSNYIISRKSINLKEPDWFLLIDLYIIHHFNNEAKATALKWIECAMNWHSVEDLPFPPGMILDSDQIGNLISYGWNDVGATKAFAIATKDKVMFHVKAKEEFGVPTHNISDVGIGELIMKREYEKLGKRAEGGTQRGVLNIKDLVPDHFKFKSDIQRQYLTIKEGILKDDFHFSFQIGSKYYKMASGGLHSIDSAMEYQANDEMMMLDIDVDSMYPSTMINYKYFPEHLGVEWLDAYKGIRDKRIEHKRLRKQDPKHQLYSDVLKLSLNGGGFGKTNSKYSWQYDPKVTFSVTLTGQVALLMLIERYHLVGIEVISANTDGILLYFNRKRLDEVTNIYKQWEEETMYIMEPNPHYQKYYAWNVNNYIVVVDDGKTRYTKEKGAYEVDRKVGGQFAYHKNHSKRICRLAVREMLLNNVPIEDTIRNNEDIFNFLIHLRSRGGKKGKAQYYVGDTFAGKTIRVLPSKKGLRLFKHFPDGSKSVQLRGEAVKLASNINDVQLSDINHDYFIREARQLIYRRDKKTKATSGQYKLV